MVPDILIRKITSPELEFGCPNAKLRAFCTVAQGLGLLQEEKELSWVVSKVPWASFMPFKQKVGAQTAVQTPTALLLQ